MGYNTTVVVYNDALGEIGQDEKFGEKLADAISRVSGNRKSVDVPSGCHVNAAMVVESHHADSTALITVGGNLGINHLVQYGWGHHQEDFQVKLLEAWARQLGYRITALPSPETIKASEVSNLKMVARNEQSISKVVHQGKVMEWVGIGWIVIRDATAEDRLNITRVVNEDGEGT